MSRTVSEIKMQMTNEFIGKAEIIAKYNLVPLKTFEEQFSKVSLESIIFYVVAFGIYLVEVLFDTHKIEVNQVVDNERWGQLSWYEKMALKYQYGRELVVGYDYYDNSTMTEENIEEEKVVKFAAATDTQEGQIILKLAKGQIGAIEPLLPYELAGVSAYFNARGGLKPAGVRVNCISINSDMLKLSLSIQYDALILNAEGKRLDGTNNQPVLDAINAFLSSVEFAGEYSNMRLVDVIQQVDGVKIVDLNAAWSKYAEYDYTLIQSRYQPQAGFMKFDSVNSIINYLPYV